MVEDMYLISACKSLGASLDKLNRKVAEIDDTDLKSLAQTCIGFHGIVTSEIDEMTRRTSQLEKMVESLEGSDEVYASAFLKSMELKEAGTSMRTIYDCAMQNQLSKIQAIRLLRSLFNISLEEAVAIAS